MLKHNTESNIQFFSYFENSFKADWELEEKKSPPNWPGNGTIAFEDYSTRYRPGLDLVLKNITCEIRPAEKVSIEKQKK